MSRFWFMNHAANPFVKLLLRSPFHRLASDSILLLTYRGRKSGKEYTLPVEYAQIGQTFYIVPGAAKYKTWWRNLSGGAPVRLRVRGQELFARAEIVAGEQDEGGLVDGLRVYFERYPVSAKMRGIYRMSDGRFDRDEIRQAARKMTVVRATIS